MSETLEMVEMADCKTHKSSVWVQLTPSEP